MCQVASRITAASIIVGVSPSLPADLPMPPPAAPPPSPETVLAPLSQAACGKSLPPQGAATGNPETPRLFRGLPKWAAKWTVVRPHTRARAMDGLFHGQLGVSLVRLKAVRLAFLRALLWRVGPAGASVEPPPQSMEAAFFPKRLVGSSAPYHPATRFSRQN